MGYLFTSDNPEARCLGLNVLFDVVSVCPYFAHILNFARWWSFQGWLCQTALNNLKWPQTVANSSTVIGQPMKFEINFHYERVKAIFSYFVLPSLLQGKYYYYIQNAYISAQNSLTYTGTGCLSEELITLSFVSRQIALCLYPHNWTFSLLYVWCLRVAKSWTWQFSESFCSDVISR